MCSLVTIRAAPSAPSRVVLIGVGHREAIRGLIRDSFHVSGVAVCLFVFVWVRASEPGRR